MNILNKMNFSIRYQNYLYHYINHINRSSLISEALPVDNRWANFFIFLLVDPHGLECRQRSKDRATKPYRELPLWRCKDFYVFLLAVFPYLIIDLLPHPLAQSVEKRGASTKDDILEEVPPDTWLALID